MGYHDLKILHFFSAMLMFGMAALLMSSASSKERLKSWRKYFFLLITLGTLGTGLTIMGRFGLKIYGPYPTWISVKLGIWLAILIITPITVKYFPQKSMRLFIPWTLLIFIAIAFSVYKPM